eukprot:12012928-Karenia_brevis.AAC.1
MRSQESPGGARRAHEIPGEPRRCQESPGGPRRAEEVPEEPRRCQESPGGARRKKLLWTCRTPWGNLMQGRKANLTQGRRVAI